MNKALSKTFTTVGLHQVEFNKCYLLGIVIGTDGINDPTVGVYNGTSTLDPAVLPETEFDASLKGLNGVMFSAKVDCPNGILVNIQGLGAREVTVYYEVYGWNH